MSKIQRASPLVGKSSRAGSNTEKTQSRPRLLARAAVLVGITAVAYLPSLRGDFIWDDNSLITNNRLIHSPQGLYQIWFTTQPIDYWPLTNSGFWLEWRLWGANPAGFHVVNLLLHIASALLIWKILRKLSISGAYLAAVLFVVHPVNVESVAWIAQRKNTLAMVFFLISICCYLRDEDTAARDLTNEKQENRSQKIQRRKAPLALHSARAGIGSACWRLLWRCSAKVPWRSYPSCCF